MSAKVTEVEMPNGSKMAFEYDDIKNDEFLAVGIPISINPKERMEKIKSGVENTLKIFSETVVSLMDKELIDGVKPKSISFDFGIQLGGEMGVPFVTKGSTKANFKVSITWELKKGE